MRRPSLPTSLTTLACARENGVKTQYVYGCRLLTMDPGLRCGPEFDDPERGVYEVVRLPLTPEAITAVNLVPRELGAYLEETIDRLPSMIPV